MVTLLGLGIWHYYYSDFSGTGNGNGGSTSSSTSNASSSTQPDLPRINITNNQTPDTPVRTNKNIARDFHDNAVDWSRPNQINVVDRLSNLRPTQSQAVPTLSSPSSPTNSDGSGDTIRPGDTPKDMVYKTFLSSRNNNNNNK